jgi:hypothetical protein
MPWFRTIRQNPEINLLHRLAFSLGTKEKTGFPVLLVYGFVWPMLAFVRCTREMLEQRKRIKELYGVGALRLWFESYYYAIFYNIEAEAYYHFQLWEPFRKKQVFSLVQDFEVGLILNHINRNRDVGKLDDKQRFIRFACELGLPTPEVVSTYQSGKMMACAESFPHQDLFVKNNNRNCGLGAMRWKFDQDDTTWIGGDLCFNEKDLNHFLLRKSTDFDLILQVCEKLHPDLLKFSKGGIATLRVISFKLRDSDAMLFHSFFRMPVGDAVTDNFSDSGLASRVSKAGMLGYATTISVRDGIAHKHPDTGEQITGSRLPFYKEMVQLALDAHNAMPEFSTVGWDISVTGKGPVIIEANSWWGLANLQITSREILATDLFLEYVKTELEIA